MRYQCYDTSDDGKVGKAMFGYEGRRSNGTLNIVVVIVAGDGSRQRTIEASDKVVGPAVYHLKSERKFWV